MAIRCSLRQWWIPLCFVLPAAFWHAARCAEERIWANPPCAWFRLMNRKTSPCGQLYHAYPLIRCSEYILRKKISAEEPGHRVPDDGLALLEAHARGVLRHLKHVHHLCNESLAGFRLYTDIGVGHLFGVPERLDGA